MKIFIDLKTFYRHVKVEADLDRNVVMINNEKAKIDANNFAKKILNIVANWQENYYGNLLDSDSYQITIQEGNLQKFYHGQGNYPLNYGDFKRLIGEISGARI